MPAVSMSGVSPVPARAPSSQVQSTDHFIFESQQKVEYRMGTFSSRDRRCTEQTHGVDSAYFGTTEGLNAAAPNPL